MALAPCPQILCIIQAIYCYEMQKRRLTLLVEVVNDNSDEFCYVTRLRIHNYTASVLRQTHHNFLFQSSLQLCEESEFILIYDTVLWKTVKSIV